MMFAVLQSFRNLHLDALSGDYPPLSCLHASCIHNLHSEQMHIFVKFTYSLSLQY